MYSGLEGLYIKAFMKKGATNRIIAFDKTPTNIIKVIDEKMYFFKLQMSAFEDLKYK